MKKYLLILAVSSLFVLLSCKNTSDVVLERGYYGTVVDENGKPVADADVCILPILPVRIYVANKDKNNGEKTQSIENAELISFNYSTFAKYNEFKWSTASEMMVREFVLEKKVSYETEDKYIAVGRVNAIGNSTTVQNYSLRDYNISSIFSYNYRLQIFTSYNTFSFSEPILVPSRNPNLLLNECSPNPFVSYVNFGFSNPIKQTIDVKIQEDITKIEYFNLVQEYNPGNFEFKMDANIAHSGDSNRSIRPGFYNLLLKSKDTTLVMQMFHYFKFDSTNCDIPLEVTKTDKDGNFFIAETWFPQSKETDLIRENGSVIGKFFTGDSSKLVVRKIIEKSDNTITYGVAQKDLVLKNSSSNKMITKKFVIKK